MDTSELKSLIGFGIARFSIAIATAVIIQLGGLYIVWESLNSRMSDLSATQDQIEGRVGNIREDMGFLKAKLGPVDFQKFGNLSGADAKIAQWAQLGSKIVSVALIPRARSKVSTNGEITSNRNSAFVWVTLQEEYFDELEKVLASECGTYGGNLIRSNSVSCMFDEEQTNLAERKARNLLSALIASLSER